MTVAKVRRRGVPVRLRGAGGAPGVAAGEHGAQPTPAGPTGRRAGTCLALTFLNPHVYLDTVVLLGTLANQHADGRWLFGVGAATASIVWFFGLGFGARRLAGLVRHAADLEHPRRADRGDHDRPGHLAGSILKTDMRVNGRVNRFMGHNQCMSEPPRPPSLRERKKVRTRETIRQEAFRLFDERGYDETTVEHIADAADISPTHILRYFPNKECTAGCRPQHGDLELSSPANRSKCPRSRLTAKRSTRPTSAWPEKSGTWRRPANGSLHLA